MYRFRSADSSILPTVLASPVEGDEAEAGFEHLLGRGPYTLRVHRAGRGDLARRPGCLSKKGDGA